MRGLDGHLGAVFYKKIVVVILTLFVIKVFCEPSDLLPSKIFTTDGKTYNGVKLIKAEPNGLVIQYTPDAGGIGLATLKFTNLPKLLQEQFNYNPTNASEYEKNEASAAAALSQKMQADEKIRADTQTQLARPEFHWHISDPAASYSYYDSNGPKPPAFDSDPWAVAMTQHSFNCDPNFTFHWTQKGTNEPFVFYFDTITVSLGLSIHIILPKNAYASIKAHEEGHRKIYENFYKLGQAVVQHAVESMIDGEMISHASNFESAKSEVLAKAQSAVRFEYLRRIEIISKQANVHYDELASHDGNNFNPDDAVKTLTEEYEQKVWTPSEGR
jgi:hypothetical protein